MNVPYCISGHTKGWRFWGSSFTAWTRAEPTLLID